MTGSPRSVPPDRPGGKRPGVDHADDRHLADPEFLDHFVEHQFPTRDSLPVAVRQKMVIIAEQLHPTGGPAQTADGLLAEPVENSGDDFLTAMKFSAEGKAFFRKAATRI
jgi:hypothetical protein